MTTYFAFTGYDRLLSDAVIASAILYPQRWLNFTLQFWLKFNLQLTRWKNVLKKSVKIFPKTALNY